MAKEIKKFSAFKLFYDELIYKDKISVVYDNVAKHLRKIKELTLEVRKFPKIDLKEYANNLEKANKKLKTHLYDIQKKNNALFEYYYILYKTQVEVCTEKLEDMPFIICCSFYEDYRLDNKTVDELETSKFTVPKYNSLEKKKIRDVAKSLSRFEYFVKLISECKNKDLYKEDVDKIKIMMNVSYMAKDSRDEFLEQIDFGRFKKIFDSIEDKARLTEDYEYISDLMGIAYKKKFTNWSKELDECILEYYDNKYTIMRNSREIRGVLNEVNDISYSQYQKIISDLIAEKNRYDEMFKSGKFNPIMLSDGSYTSKFKESLINNFFDSRYINNFRDSDTPGDYVNRAVLLYGLANDLANQIFEKVVFDSSHSPALKRNNDVRSSIIEKIYELYNPVFLLAIYDKTRSEFEQFLNQHDPRFIQEYNLKLTEKKLKYNFHGPLPSMSIIEMRVSERKKMFIIDNCITELKSKYDGYDTRNYDLSLVSKDLYINDMIEIYDKMKMKVNSYVKEKNQVSKDKLMSDLQEFVVKNIYLKLNTNNESLEEEKNKYKDICYSYLNEKCVFVSDKESNEDNSTGNISIEKFMKSKWEFSKKSKWTRLLIDNNMKVGM